MIGLRVVKPSAKLVTPVEWFEKMPWLIEYCGRKSHKSEERMKDGSSDAFIKKVARKLGHESIIEHISVTYDVTCSRACSHQLVRHRISSYTQESQRFCDYGKGDDNILNIIVPPSIADLPEGTLIDDTKINNADAWASDTAEFHFFRSVIDSYMAYLHLRNNGVPPEDARFTLPNASKTEIAVTFNLRVWRHVFKHRALNKFAQWEIKGVFQWILGDLAERLPMVFEDLVSDA